MSNDTEAALAWEAAARAADAAVAAACVAAWSAAMAEHREVEAWCAAEAAAAVERAAVADRLVGLGEHEVKARLVKDQHGRGATGNRIGSRFQQGLEGGQIVASQDGEVVALDELVRPVAGDLVGQALAPVAVADGRAHLPEVSTRMSARAAAEAESARAAAEAAVKLKGGAAC